MRHNLQKLCMLWQKITLFLCKKMEEGVCMAFGFRKSLRLGKHGRVNVSKSGVGFSWGVPGLRFTKTARGQNRVTVSIPGTGLRWTKTAGKKR